MSWRPSRVSTAAWATYDLANTIFALGVGGLYFASWLSDNDLPDIALSLAIDGAMLVVIVFAPLIGARTDHAGRRLPTLLALTVAAVVPTFFLASFDIATTMALFVLATIAFNLGSIVYDALLPDVSTPENRGRVSGTGVGLGYIGSFIAIGAGTLVFDTYGYPGVFRAIAVLFAAFAIPTFVFVKERPRPPATTPKPRPAESVQRLVSAWQLSRRYQGVTRFLVGRFFYSDAINTLIAGFLTILAREELGFTTEAVESLLGLGIALAVVGGFAGGRLTDALGPRRVLHGSLAMWMVAMALGVVAIVRDLDWLAWGLGGLGGLALGATWASDRVYMARISPPRHLGEFYGLYAMVGRFATILGPLTWGVVVNVLHLPRVVALGTLIGFLVVSRFILSGVDDADRNWDRADQLVTG